MITMSCSPVQSGREMDSDGVGRQDRTGLGCAQRQAAHRTIGTRLRGFIRTVQSRWKTDCNFVAGQDGAGLGCANGKACH